VAQLEKFNSWGLHLLNLLKERGAPSSYGIKLLISMHRLSHTHLLRCCNNIHSFDLLELSAHLLYKISLLDSYLIALFSFSFCYAL